VHDGVSESPDRYDTLDLSDNLIFAIDGGIRNIRRKRVLCDYTGIPLPSMKTMSDDLLFSVTKPSLFSFKTSLDVSLLPQQPLIDISNIELDLKKKNIELYFRKYSRYIGYSFKLFEPIYNTLLAEARH
ncbi:unnamed protein product, partial [Brassica oleracea var. botrytis]